MKILVSGGAGFIGSHLVDQLLLEGHDVMVVDTTALADSLNLAHQASHPRLRSLQHDVVLPLPTSVRRFKPQQIYNLASCDGPEQRRRDPVHAAITSVIGTQNLLKLAHDTGARLLQGSSGGIYGDPAVHPQPESYLGNVNAYGHRASHDESKRCAETLCFAYQTSRRVDVCIARIFSTYGPRMDPQAGRVISNFIMQALSGDDLTLHGDGTQTRSFCHVDDMVRGLYSLMNSGVTGPVNLGTAEEHNLLQVAERVLRMTGSQSRLRHCAPRSDDANCRRPDITLAERQLSWRPRVSLQQGMQSTVNHFRRQSTSTVGS
jgi:UDP-glucuronate decarboxylase